MSKAGEVLDNPINGNKILIGTVTEELVEVELFLNPGKPFVAPHVHAIQTETYEIFSGRGRYILNGVEKDVRPGDRIELAPGTPHVNPWAVGDELLHYRQSNTPGLDFDVYFETAYKAAQAGHTKPDGGLHLVHQAVILNGTRSKSYLVGPPILLQKLLFPILSLVGRLKGYPFRYTD